MSLKYADVILPLPLQGTFTYSIPEDMESVITRGCRVLVQFGKKKFYTGIVVDIHNNVPENYEVKPIVSLLDKDPAIRYPQYKFWNWIADYYLCSPGDVMKAALPSGLKVESETFISLNKEFDIDAADLSEQQAVILIALSNVGRMRVSELEKVAGIERLGREIEQLLESGAVEISERAVEHYRPSTETMVELCASRDDEDKRREFFRLVGRSPKQEKLLLAYIGMSGMLRSGEELKEVSKKALLESAGVASGIFKALVDKGIFKVYRKKINRFNPTGVRTSPLAELSGAQQTALKEIHQSFKERNVVLLHGVTGSGKTEIYTHLIEHVLSKGDQVLYLVPEISLTTQLSDRLRRVFGDRLLVYHSKFTDNERVDIWQALLTARSPLVVLGVRSSVFLPFHHIGLVIVDEEHEPSFKQYDPAPRYNARDAAIVLASMHGAKTLLGSATPSVETYYKALCHKYGLVELSCRYEGASLPDVRIIDMRDQRRRKSNRGILSEPLIDSVNAALEEGNQAIMFQNRRGFAPIVVCRECGWTPKCVNCDVSLIYHKNISQLKCHYCGHSAYLPNVCPACGQNSIEVFGYGTERIAEEVQEVFPASRVARMDLDTTRNKEAFQQIIEDFSIKNTDILVGTQMVSKGLDFEKVRVVGVLNADTILNFPDFRSGERAFNMLEQVAGRAGRRKEKGEVVIQTTSPESGILEYVKAHDYRGYFESELADRKRYNYPPFTRVVNIYLKHENSAVLDSLAVDYATNLRRVFGKRILGPEKPYVSRVSNYYLQSIMLKVESEASMVKVKGLLRQIYVSMAADARLKQAVVYYDVDPV